MVGPTLPRTALRACILATLACAGPVLAAAPAFSLERAGPFEVVGSPGEPVVLPATLVNGAQGASFGFLAASTNKSGAWEVFAPRARELAPGQNATLGTVASLPGTGGVSVVSMQACPKPPGSCLGVSWRVSTPLVVELEMEPSFGALESVSGIVTVSWRNGAPVRDAPVTLTHQAGLLGGKEEFTTDAHGRVAFFLASPSAYVPGEHVVLVEAKLLNVTTGTDVARYTVALT